MKKKAAIVQFEAVHEEIVPSIDFYLNSIGYETSSYLNNNILKRKGDFFKDSGFEFLDYKYVIIEKRQDWIELKNQVKSQKKLDMLVLNTFQRQSVINWSLDFNIPVLGVVHNPLILLSVPGIKDVLSQNKNIYLLGLAPHVASYLMSCLPFMQDRIGFIDPILWGGEKNDKNPNVNKKIISIPGGINFKNRDYIGLIDNVDEAKHNGMSSEDIVIRLLGGGKDRGALIQLIKDRELDEYFDFSETNESGFVPYKTYLSDLQDSSFLLPMFKKSDTAYRTYKISSVISSSVGNSIPLLQDNWTSFVYQVPGVTYNSKSLANTLLNVSLFDKDAYSKILVDSISNRESWISRSKQQMIIFDNFIS